MTISEIFSFLNSKGFGKREGSYVEFLSYTFSCYVCTHVLCVCYLWWQRNANSRSNLTCLPCKG